MMKSISVFFTVLLVSTGAMGFSVRTTESGNLIRWHQRVITVTLDSSLALIGPVDEVYGTIEAAFDTWIDQTDLDKEIVFEYAPCDRDYRPGGDNVNCVYADVRIEGQAGGNTAVSYDVNSGKIRDVDIVFYVDAGEWRFGKGMDHEGLDFGMAALHEVGHFWGLGHSSVEEAVMFPSMTASRIYDANLHTNDVEAVWTLYDSLENPEWQDCSVVAGVARRDGRKRRGLLSVIAMLLGG